MPSLSWPYLALILSIVGFTFGAPTLRLVHINGMPTEALIALRLPLAVLILTPFVFLHHRHELRSLTLSDIGLTALAGAVMTLHLLLIVESLRYTTIVFNQVLVNTGPIWVALLEVVALGAKFGRQVWLGLAVAILGSGVLLLYSALQGTALGGPNTLLGNVMAVVSAIVASVYIVLGRSIRQKVSFLPYVWLLFSAGGITALTVVFFRGLPLVGYSSEAYFWVVMVTIFPTLIGHAAFNYALRGLSATLVTLSGQVSTLTTAVVAYFAFAEVPTFGTVAGGAIIVLGVIITATAKQQSAPLSTQSALPTELEAKVIVSSRQR
jgi:drug/metabolite transporter (DMT)-like permease